MNDYICLLEDYLGTIEGKMIKIKPIDRAQSAKLPLYISSSFRFFETKLLGNEVVLACIEDGDDFAPLQMKKTLSIIEEKIGKPVVLAPQRQASYNQLRLVNQRVGFVIPGKQLFIPDLLVNLKKEENRNVDLGDTIPPMAQCMLLYHIQVKSIHGKNTQEAAEEFFVSYATINRAIRWLTKHKLIGLRGAKTKHIEISLPKREKTYGSTLESAKGATSSTWQESLSDAAIFSCGRHSSPRAERVRCLLWNNRKEAKRKNQSSMIFGCDRCRMPNCWAT